MEELMESQMEKELFVQKSSIISSLTFRKIEDYTPARYTPIFLARKREREREKVEFDGKEKRLGKINSYYFLLIL